jgi:DNA-binding PadR family transcriptional regulator
MNHGPHHERGWIQFLLLMQINEKPIHGYKLAKELQSKRYVRKDRFKTGSLYTILNRMEKKGVLTSEYKESKSSRQRRVYSITEHGRIQLKNSLQYMLCRKRFFDEIEHYYHKHFPESNVKANAR